MSILNLPLVARKEDRTILEANGSILADVWWHDDTPNNKWNADANARAAEVVRRVNMHDDLLAAAEALRHQVEQMRGMFGDEDGTIAAACKAFDDLMEAR